MAFGGQQIPSLFLGSLPARKESAKEKQLKEEEKILESVAEGRGEWVLCISDLSPELPGQQENCSLPWECSYSGVGPEVTVGPLSWHCLA